MNDLQNISFNPVNQSLYFEHRGRWSDPVFPGRSWAKEVLSKGELQDLLLALPVDVLKEIVPPFHTER